MSFEERFDLLLASGQANAQSIAATRSALEWVEQQYGIQLTEELGAFLAAHLAITMKRLLDGETLVPMPDVVWQELNDYPDELRDATNIVARLEQELNLAISRDELGFIAVHLCKIKLQLRSNART